MCENVLFFGSASKMPHTQGAFREQFIVDKDQCHLLDISTSFEEAAFVEPVSIRGAWTVCRKQCIDAQQADQRHDGRWVRAQLTGRKFNRKK